MLNGSDVPIATETIKRWQFELNHVIDNMV